MKVLQEFLARCGFTKNTDIIPLPGGGNNRGYRIVTPFQTFFLKEYFHHSSDKRNRLGTEYGFCKFLWDQGVRLAPRPLAKDARRHLGLYEYIPGDALRAYDVNEKRIEEVINFIREINEVRFSPSAKKLPAASEACFSIRDQLNLVEGRVARLTEIENDGPYHAEAKRLVEEELEPLWEEVRNRALRGKPPSAPLNNKELVWQERCLSSSDFGFHNTLKTSSGALRFVDFEYAGWDDPAKMICDFFLQPRFDVPDRFFELFTKSLFPLFEQKDLHAARVKALYPVFAVKWACIALNIFLPVRTAHRKFALDIQKKEDRLKSQLKKAADYLGRTNGLR